MIRYQWLARGAQTCASLLASTYAHAQASSQDVATAQALFDEGKALMKAGKHAEACPKLVESQRLDPGGGTLLAIALCHEAEGKTATAWGDFNLVVTDARNNKRSDRENAAIEHIRALEPKLTRVKVMVTAKRDQLEVRRSGSVVGEAQWGVALPVDPATYAFEARAPGAVAWKANVEVRGEGKTVDVTVPALADEPPAPLPSALPATPAPAAEPPPAKESTGNPNLVWSVAVGSVGLVSLGLGAGFAVSANSKWSDAAKACPNHRCTDPADVDAGKNAGSAADLSTAFFLVGGAAVAAAGVLFFLGHGQSSRASALRVSPMAGGGAAGVLVNGSL